MACPYFFPIERNGSPVSMPLPLGEAWTGTCHSPAGAMDTPEPAVIGSMCSFGYARGRCACFAADDAGPDAVRFTISGDNGATLDLYYVLERDHHPFAHGPLQYSLALGRFVDPAPPVRLARQAEAYVESYLLRRSLQRNA